MEYELGKKLLIKKTGLYENVERLDLMTEVEVDKVNRTVKWGDFRPDNVYEYINDSDMDVLYFDTDLLFIQGEFDRGIVRDVKGVEGVKIETYDLLSIIAPKKYITWKNHDIDVHGFTERNIKDAMELIQQYFSKRQNSKKVFIDIEKDVVVKGSQNDNDDEDYLPHCGSDDFPGA